MGRFKDALLAQEEFVYSCEFVPGRGRTGKNVEECIEFGKFFLLSGCRVHALSITDNPGGNPAICPDVLAHQLTQLNLDPLVHFSCANCNRNVIESRAHALARDGIENLLVLTGDYPVGGYGGRAKPVFDLDAVQAIQYLKDLNAGLETPGRKEGSTVTLPSTNFFIGCAVSPFKLTEPEMMTQFFKMEKKVRAGTDFIIPQLGYDVRKFAEILKYLQYRGLDVPVLGNVYAASRPAARAMNQGLVPGCVVTDEFVSKLDEEAKAPDKGKGARLERAARLTAIFRGMKFRGVHIGGFGLTAKDFIHIIMRSEAIGDNWRDYISDFRYGRPGEFYLFPDDPELTFDDDKLEPVKPAAKRHKPVHFQMGLLVHRCIFVKGTIGYRLMQKIYQGLENHRLLSAIAHFFEHLAKMVLFDCRDCGDCSLFDLAYLCPMSQCAKFQRNGPCGGSRDGMCEVYPDEKPCVWAKAYERMKSSGDLDTMRTAYIPPRKGELEFTSAWSNFYNGRDHTSAAMAAEASAPAGDTA